MNETDHTTDTSAALNGRCTTRMTRRRRVVFALVSLAGLLLVGELIVRLLHLSPVLYTPPRLDPPDIRTVDYIPPGINVYPPNSTFAQVYDLRGDDRGYFAPDGRIVYRMNEHGLRGPSITVEKPPNTFRVLCLGDSFTFGEGVRQHDTYPTRLQALLSQAMPDKTVEVLNAGVRGYGTRHE
ncbi:MAG: SGNH/GDSL hydrolase family protein, partial [Dehalococcoidia bacterium]